MSNDHEKLELSVAAHYLVDRNAPPRSSTLVADHFSNAKARLWWDRAVRIGDGYSLDELQLTPDDLDALNAAYVSVKLIPDYERRIKLAWVHRQVRKAHAQWRSTPDTIERDTATLITSLTNALAGSPSKEMRGREALSNLMANLSEVMKSGEPQHIPVPWRPLEMIVGGLPRGKLILVGGRSSEHKTTMARSMADHASISGHRSLFWTMEDSTNDLAARYAASHNEYLDAKSLAFGPTKNKMHETSISRGFESVVQLANSKAAENIWFLDTAEPTLSQVTSAIRSAVARLSVTLVVLDFMQLILPDSGRSADSNWWRSAIATIAGLAKSLNICVLCTSQIEKTGTQSSELEERIPRGMEMPFGSMLRQGAYGVIMVGTSDKDPGGLHVVVDKWKSSERGSNTRFRLNVNAAHDRLWE